MGFDGAVKKSGVGIGIMLVTPNGEQLWISKRLYFLMTNDVAKYEVCIYGLEALIAVEDKKFEATRDSLLVISQIRKEQKIKEDKLRSYLQYAKQQLLAFKEVKLRHVPRMQNQLVDALATISSLWEISDKKIMQPVVLMKSMIPSNEGPMIEYLELEDKKWLEGIKRYLKSREYPEELTEEIELL